jgi:2-methylcitrate dehydratase
LTLFFCIATIIENLIKADMQTLSKRLARYTRSFSYDCLPEEVIHEVKRRLIDTLGCAVAAYGSPPGEIARQKAISLKSDKGATVLGGNRKSQAELAAFANGTFVRYLDYNDTYLSKEPAHPSDNIPAALAVAETERVDGKKLIAAIALGYEIQSRFCDAASLRVRGWDHVTYGALSTAILSGWLMGLDEGQMENAVSLAAVCNNALRQTRVGEISLWKAAAFANAGRNGIFAASLSRLGMTGPEEVFEGEKGYFNAVSGPISLPILGGEKGAPFKILESYIKLYPVEYHAQSAVHAALSLYPDVVQEGNVPEIVESIEVRTSSVSREIIGLDPEKWNPKTRETADHSLPYCVAVALYDGTVGLSQFDGAHLRDERLRRLIKKVEVVEDDDLTVLYPGAIGNQVEIKTKSARHLRRVDHPKGHPKNPMTDEEVGKKFRDLCQGRLPSRRIGLILDLLWNMERNKELGEVLSYFAVGAR